MISEFEIIDTDPRKVAEHASLFRVSPLIVHILHSRGYTSPIAIERFLNPRLSELHSPFLMHGIDEAVHRIKRAVEADEKIGLFSDSDLDGITSLAVMRNLFNRMKIYPYCRYLKDDEDYGLSYEIIDDFNRNNVTLVITLDSGIRDIEEIRYARDLGIDIIVTDHHEQDKQLPDAIIVNPKIIKCGYPFKSLAGVGVAFKLSHSLLLSYIPGLNKRFYIIAQNNESYGLSIIYRGNVERISSAHPPEDLKRIISESGNEDMILLDSDAENNDDFTHGKIVDFTNFINATLTGSTLSLEDLCNKFKINRTVIQSRIDLLTKIFLEAQLQGSSKIMDYIESVLSFVSIGSIADVTPLVDENRILVKEGINLLKEKRHYGLSLLTGDSINGKTISWGIAPLLNTPGRMGKTDLAVNFFMETSKTRIKSIVEEITILNNDRKNIIAELYSQLSNDIDAGTIPTKGNLIFIKTERIPDGFAGLIANRISEKTEKPVIIAILPGKNGIVKGSGRVIGNFNFFSYIEKYSHKFERIGGHAQAFGFTIRETDIDCIMHMLNDEIPVTIKKDPTRIDCIIDVSQITVSFVNDLEMLGPYGNGNEEPLFLCRNLNFHGFTRFGSNHGRYTLNDNQLTAIGWNKSDEMERYFNSGKGLDIIFRLEKNTFRGSTSPRMIIEEIITPE